MEKVRIGNDLRINFSVYRNGEPESFDGATNISTKIVNESYNKTIAHTYSIVDNVIQFNIDALELKQCGKCRVFISYTKVGDYTVDSPAFELVQYTEDTGGTEVIGIEIVKINISGDIGINRDGASAYEVWESYTGNEGKTIEQYFEWLRENPTKIDLDGLNSNIDKLHFKPDTLVQLANIGDVRYSQESRTLEVKVSDTVSIQLGQEMQTRVKNDEAIQINNGQMVYINSAVGANPLAKLASTTNADIAQRTFGMATENIASNGFGAITTEGLVRDINTSAFPEGSMLWLGTNGSVTNIEPTAPTSKISVGMVLMSNANNGVVYVKIRAIARNQKLSDVYAPTLTGGDVLRWNSTTLRFETFNITSALSNKVDTSRTITAGNGLTGGGVLTEDRTININNADDSLTVTADNIKVNTNNTLTSTSTTQPLSANQGKVLNEKVVQVETDLNQNISELSNFDLIPSRFGWLGASAFTLLSKSKHKIISLKGGETIKIVGNSFYTTPIYLVKSYITPAVNNLNPDFATGETGRRIIDVNQILQVTAPEDARYIVVGTSYDGTQNNVPKLISIDNFDITIGTKKEIINLKAEVSNLKDEVSNLNDDVYSIPYVWTSGVIGTNGVISAGTYSNYYSQIIPNALINNKSINSINGYIYNFAYYNNGVFVSRDSWKSGINAISTQYDVRIMLSSNIPSSNPIEQVLPNFTIPIIGNPLENRISVLENKTDLSLSLNYMNKINCSEFDGKVIHFSFDDVCWCLYDIIQNFGSYSSIFENPFFQTIQTIHNNTGAVFTLNTFNNISTNAYGYYPPSYNIINLPSKFQAEFQANKGWIKFAFHGENENSNYNTSIGILSAYNTFVSSIYNLTGDYDCIDRITRLGYFGGTLENCLAIKNADHGVVGLLGADDERAYDYYLTPEQYGILRSKGKYADFINELFFIKTQTRNITPSASFESIIESNPCYQKYTEVFAHEYEYYGYGNALATMITNFSTIANWANTKGYINSYPYLIIG